MYSWSLAWRILSITLLVCEMSAVVWYFEHSLRLEWGYFITELFIFQTVLLNCFSFVSAFLHYSKLITAWVCSLKLREGLGDWIFFFSLQTRNEGQTGILSPEMLHRAQFHDFSLTICYFEQIWGINVCFYKKTSEYLSWHNSWYLKFHF